MFFASTSVIPSSSAYSFRSSSKPLTENSIYLIFIASLNSFVIFLRIIRVPKPMGFFVNLHSQKSIFSVDVSQISEFSITADEQICMLSLKYINVSKYGF